MVATLAIAVRDGKKDDHDDDDLSNALQYIPLSTIITESSCGKDAVQRGSASLARDGGHLRPRKGSTHDTRSFGG